MNPGTDPIIVFPNLSGYLVRIADGSRRPPTVYLTAAQLAALRDTITALLDGPADRTDRTPPGAYALDAYALGF